MMKTVRTGVMIIAAIFVVTACNVGLSDSRGLSSKGANDRVDRSQRTVMDAAKYVDFTARTINAAKYTKQDFLFEVSGTYRLAGGNSFITVDRTEGIITLSSDDAWYNDSAGHNMYARYIFDVQAANEDCLYVKISNKRRAYFIIDSTAADNQAIPDLAVCLPLYGFSRNRIEVSPIMDGYIAMPSGTYWADKQ
jgi:hypothetical protein